MQFLYFLIESPLIKSDGLVGRIIDQSKHKEDLLKMPGDLIVRSDYRDYHKPISQMVGRTVLVSIDQICH